MGINEIKAIYEDYLETAKKLEEQRKPTDGLFGMGKKPADDPCHEKFADDLEKALDEMAAEDISAQEAAQVLGYIYDMPVRNGEYQSIYWMLVAVHGLTEKLIDKLTAEDAAKLKKSYGANFKRWERLPAQQKVYAALSHKK
ncbi:MAG: hypothetical protein IK999_13330 [Ruminococcus sp.]|nr:hypothetical protein [Ruminococcus sp.]